MSCLEIINIVAIILSPIVAVVIGRQLQDRANTRKDKMEIFKVLMEGREEYVKKFLEGNKSDNSIHEEIVRHINLIPIVFQSKVVLEKYNDICEAHRNLIQRVENSAFLPKDSGACLDAYKALLTAVGTDLGYKNIKTFEYTLKETKTNEKPPSHNVI